MRKSGRRTCALVASAVLATLLFPVPVSANEGLVKLTIAGPTNVVLDRTATYNGTLKAAGMGLAGENVDLLLDGRVAAAGSTMAGGVWSIDLPLHVYGSHTVAAVWRRGTPVLQRTSRTLAVEVVAETEEAEDTTSTTDLATSSQFIFSGPSAVQTGLDVATLNPTRVAVLHGQVRTPSGAGGEPPKVTVLDRPEFGKSKVRTDGQADMVVNGGEILTVQVDKPGFLPMQRTITVPWRDYAQIPPVELTPLDSRVTAVDLANATGITVHQATAVTDADGTRQATLMFKPGTSASMVLPDGTTQPLPTMNVRATEYTVGDRGPQAMPGDLPPASGYTYAVEFSSDEALAAGASEVRFDRPVAAYVDNFLNFPAGGRVPLGYYDKEQGAWIAAPDGRVVQIVSETGGRADVDIDGDGLADSADALAALGIDDAERVRLADIYAPGKSLWRIQVTHFTPWDCNWPYGLPDGAGPPGQPEDEEPDPESDCGFGLSVNCHQQAFRDQLPLIGSSFSLAYSSERVPGRKDRHAVSVSLTGASPPPSLKRVELEVSIAGRKYTYSYPTPVPNMRQLVLWDGKDAYGRYVQGAQTANVQIGYVYQAVYRQPREFAASFGQAGGAPVSGSRARQEITVYQRWQKRIGGVTRIGALGGWSLDAHHVYDPSGRIVYRGDGSIQYGGAIQSVVRTQTGNGTEGYSGDGGPASAARIGHARGVAVAADGSVMFADTSNAVIRRIDGSGIIRTFAGGGDPPSGNGDGGPANEARLIAPRDVAVHGGNLYISDSGTNTVRRVDAAGIIQTVAGGGQPADGLGDGGLATAAALNRPRGLAVGPDGTLYIADMSNDRVRAVEATGVIRTVAGGGSPPDGLGDGGLALDAALDGPTHVAVGDEGTLFVSDRDHNRVRGIRSDGVIGTVAGNGTAGYSGDGGPAIDAALTPEGLSVGPDGSLYIADRLHHRVRKVLTDGIIRSLIGTGAQGFGGDEAPSPSARLAFPEDVALTASGDLFVADTLNFRVRKLTPPFPGFSDGDLAVPSPDGSELYQFDANGKHLRTIDSMTGLTDLTFAYDASGQLTSVTDRFGNATRITRNADSKPTAIVGPDGQTTTLALDGAGYLSQITNPNGESVRYAYASGGLVSSVTDPKGATYLLTYDSLGRFVRGVSPAGAETRLVRTDTPDGRMVTATSADGRVRKFGMEVLSDGSQRITTVDPAGHTSTGILRPDGSRTVTFTDGTTVDMTTAPDPRWGMLAPIEARKTVTVRNAQGQTQTVTATRVRSVVLANPSNPLSLRTLTDTATVNGRSATGVYDATARTLRSTSPEGRTSTVTLDTAGQTTTAQAGSMLPMRYAYDARGRPSSTSIGTGTDTRTTSANYDAEGYVADESDPLGRTVSFVYDAAGRVVRVNRPDGASSQSSYDANGNLTSVTPAGRAAHSFSYAAGDRGAGVTPPSGATVQYTYSPDGNLTNVRRADGSSISSTYDSVGRLTAHQLMRGVISRAYDDATSRLTRSTGPDGSTVSYSYLGPLLLDSTSAGGLANGSVSFAYDADFRLASRSINGGNSVTFAYDRDGLLTRAGSLNVTRDTNGYPTATTLGTVATALSFSGLGELTSNRATVGGSPVFVNDYVRDKLGRIVQRNETIQGQARRFDYAYDALGRLSEVRQDGSPVVNYTYDANGNRLSADGPGRTATATYDAQDRMTSYGNFTYTYTPDGELASKTDTSAGQTTNYSYDELGNLLRAVLPNGTAIDYVVDPENRRVAKRVGGVPANGFLYAGDRIVAELDPSGAVVATFVYGNRRTVPDYMVKGGATYRFVTDHQGGVRLVVNTANGQVAQRLDYDEFGNVTGDTNPGFQPFGFAGGLYDRDTGLVRFGARDYDPAVGRWTTKDPLGFSGGSSNLYAYVANDPVNLVDPSGMGFLGFLHNILDIGGLIPGVGEIFDGINAAIYLAEGDYTNAALSAAALIPFAGWGATGAKYANKAFNHGSDALRRTTILGENMSKRVQPFADATGARTLGFGTTADNWASMTPQQRYKLNDGQLRARIGEGDNFRYIGQDPGRPADVRQRFDLTRSELLRLQERGIPYETVSPDEVFKTIGRY